jgi:hypothetical protein
MEVMKDLVYHGMQELESFSPSSSSSSSSSSSFHFQRCVDGRQDHEGRFVMVWT